MTKILMVLLLPTGIAVIIGVGVLLATNSHALTGGGALSRTRARRPGAGGLARYAAGPISRRVTYFLLALAVGAAALYGLMVLLGLLVEHAGPTIDKPIFHWMGGHTTHIWRSAMKRGTEVGDKYPTWAAAASAAVCLGVAWSRDRWVAPVALGTLILVDHFLTLAINHTVTRV